MWRRRERNRKNLGVMRVAGGDGGARGTGRTRVCVCGGRAGEGNVGSGVRAETWCGRARRTGRENSQESDTSKERRRGSRRKEGPPTVSRYKQPTSIASMHGSSYGACSVAARNRVLMTNFNTVKRMGTAPVPSSRRKNPN
eukprot:1285992-Pleurochrysis_carterae.AAC.1